MQLTKHHGLGNDFLVLLDLDDVQPVAAEEAVALCDRHSGLGADGFIRVTAGTGDADVTMHLHNADGSRAEMSGNGVRCLAQAVFQAGLAEPRSLRVATDAGLRTVTLLTSVDPRTQRLSVEMGQAKVGESRPDLAGGPVLRAVGVDLGNPHMVLLWEDEQLPDAEALVSLAQPIDAAAPGGANVEVIRADRDQGIELVVFERGVGPTLACGTGACAAAAAAHGWGLVAADVEVRMPGGAVEVTVADPVILTGPSTSVARLEVPWPPER